jgi:UDP-N-acetylmuramoyl-tripeptide--D-alanyl-D-alanine ligase
MIKRTLGEIAAMCGGITDSPDVLVAGVSIDTRALAKGNLFVPLRGERVDGHDFVRQAREGGAAAALWSRQQPAPRGIPLIFVEDTLQALQRMAGAYRQQLTNVHVIGITGSNGKTSTKDMLASILAQRYRTRATAGNQNNEIGVPLTLLALDHQTEWAVVEMGMSGRGEIGLLSRLAVPELAIITNVGEAHLADLGSLEQIAAAKLEILQGLVPAGLLVLDGDSQLLQPALAQRRCISFGFNKDNQVCATTVAMSDMGMRFRINDAAAPEFGLPVFGRHQVQNALAAIAAARALSMSYGEIRRGLQSFQPTRQRGELLRIGNTTIINDTYKSNPAGLRAALDVLCSLSGYGRRIAVLGDMRDLGAAEGSQHTAIGRLLDPAKVHAVITVGNAARQIARVAATRFPAGRVFAARDKEAALQLLRRQLDTEPALILIKGAHALALQELVQAIREQ